MSKQNWFIISLLLFSCFMYAQTFKKKETLALQGSSHFVYKNNKSYFLQETIGQASVIKTYNANNYSLRQGFLQPISATIISEHLDTTLQGVIYPNPFYNEVNVRLAEPVYDDITVVLYDVLGRLVFSQVYHPMQLLVLKFDNISSGNYLLRMQMRSEVLVAKIVRR